MKLGLLCFIVVAAGTARGAIMPDGAHVCMHEEKYIDVIHVEEPVKYIVYKTEWCWSIPPRCKVPIELTDMVYVRKEVPRVRVVPKCCKGYEEGFHRNCVPVCSAPCINGDCTAPERCICKPGFTGNRCEKPCESGTWGADCLQTCKCDNDATCNPFNGKCICTPGWQGSRCEYPCEPGFYGTNCESRCECGGDLCDNESGICMTTSTTESTTTEMATTTTESTTVTEDFSHSTETTVTESSTIAGTTQVEDSAVDGPPSSTNNLIRVYVGEENTDVTYESNETAKDNEIESSQDLTGDEIRQFSLSNIFGNLSIICGVFLFIFVVTMSSVMVSHFRKIRKTGYECNAKNNNNSNTQNFPLHRFYGGPTLPSKTILDNQVCATNVDFRVEQPILMTFKPLPDEKSIADYIQTSAESNTGVFDTDPALARQIVRVRCGEPKSLAYISTRCKSV